MVAGVIASHGCVLPFDARTIDGCIKLFVFCSFTAFLFTTVACPIAHWFYKDATTNLATDVLLWRHQIKNFDWNITAPSFHQSVWVRNFDCPALVRVFRATESISIIAICCTCCTFTCGLLLCKNLVGTRVPSLCFSYAGMITTGVQMILELVLYYKNWCNGKFAYHSHYFVLSAGFALVTSAFCIMCVATLSMTLVYILTERYFPAKKPVKTARQILVEEYR